MIKFGPSGNSESFYAAGYAHTEEAATFVKRLGLDCFEYSFGSEDCGHQNDGRCCAAHYQDGRL